MSRRAGNISNLAEGDSNGMFYSYGHQEYGYYTTYNDLKTKDYTVGSG
jgi:hypothetical protein